MSTRSAAFLLIGVLVAHLALMASPLHALTMGEHSKSASLRDAVQAAAAPAAPAPGSHVFTGARGTREAHAEDPLCRAFAACVAPVSPVASPKEAGVVMAGAAAGSPDFAGGEDCALTPGLGPRTPRPAFSADCDLAGTGQVPLGAPAAHLHPGLRFRAGERASPAVRRSLLQVFRN